MDSESKNEHASYGRTVALESLHFQLMGASKLLAASTDHIRKANLSTETNVRRIAEALVLIFEITQDIYAVRPELTPLYLRYKPDPEFKA